MFVCCIPSGFISFVSKAFGGRTTDAQITNQSGFWNLLASGDGILTDKGFPEIKTVLNDSVDPTSRYRLNDKNKILVSIISLKNFHSNFRAIQFFN